MSGKTVYLDPSALAKRYLAEEGTGLLDWLYGRAEAGALEVAFSLWNVGEVASALAQAQRRGRATAEAVETALWLLLRETRKMRALGVLRVLPVRGDLLAD